MKRARFVRGAGISGIVRTSSATANCDVGTTLSGSSGDASDPTSAGNTPKGNELVGNNATQVRISYQGQEVACHDRSYDRRQLVRHPDHELQALKQRRRVRQHEVEEAFDALGAEARQFHSCPLPPSCSHDVRN